MVLSAALIADTCGKGRTVSQHLGINHLAAINIETTVPVFQYRVVTILRPLMSAAVQALNNVAVAVLIIFPIIRFVTAEWARFNFSHSSSPPFLVPHRNHR
uniref:Uncharacterized protein n=1 Tax=Erwinia phage phiAT1 TaxID=649272 RepID=C5J9F8_9VIRU|nr:hypothetical protein [Erwinia phage phiAT1]